MTITRCIRHGGGGFVSDCVECARECNVTDAPPAGSETPEPEKYASLGVMPIDRLATNVVRSLILAKGNINRWSGAIEGLIQMMRAEHATELAAALRERDEAKRLRSQIAERDLDERYKRQAAESALATERERREQAEARAAELEMDAERYRYISEYAEDAYDEDRDHDGPEQMAWNALLGCASKEELDAAIDAALAARPA